jgi:hypothetical protein
MHDERERLRVHLVDQPIETLHFIGVVGGVAQHPERKLALRERRERSRTTAQQKENQEPENVVCP